jgi:hypothetical protein
MHVRKVSATTTDFIFSALENHKCASHCWRQWLFLLETAYCEQVSRLFPKFFLGTAYATG